MNWIQWNRIPWALGKFYFNNCIRWYQKLHHFIIPLIKKKNEPKVFCIGDVKTGNITLYKALRILGYRAVRLFNLGAWSDKYGRVYIDGLTKCNYDAFVDFPMGHEDLYQKIDIAVPNSKFILTIRDKQSWKRSFDNYFRDSVSKRRLQKYEKHNRQVVEYFKDKPSQLLVMDIIEGDGWKELCNFLNKPIPDKPFPHKNIGRYKK